MWDFISKTIRTYVEVIKSKHPRKKPMDDEEEDEDEDEKEKRRHRDKDRKKKKPAYKTVERKPFDNFFRIQDDKAIDMGSSKPAGIRQLRERSPRFALIREDRSNITNSVKTLGPITMDAALNTAKNLVEVEKDTDLTIVVGRSVGALDGRIIYQDIAGFQFKEDRLQDLTKYRLESL